MDYHCGGFYDEAGCKMALFGGYPFLAWAWKVNKGGLRVFPGSLTRHASQVLQPLCPNANIANREIHHQGPPSLGRILACEE